MGSWLFKRQIKETQSQMSRFFFVGQAILTALIVSTRDGECHAWDDTSLHNEVFGHRKVAKECKYGLTSELNDDIWLQNEWLM